MICEVDKSWNYDRFPHAIFETKYFWDVSWRHELVASPPRLLRPAPNTVWVRANVINFSLGGRGQIVPKSQQIRWRYVPRGRGWGWLWALIGRNGKKIVWQNGKNYSHCHPNAMILKRFHSVPKVAVSNSFLNCSGFNFRVENGSLQLPHQSELKPVWFQNESKTANLMHLMCQKEPVLATTFWPVGAPLLPVKLS